jgi:Flp pilus assembly protein TadG
MKRPRSGILGSTSGTAAIEFALIAPLMVLLFAGVVEIGRIYQVYNAINRLTSQVAIVYADCSDRPTGTCQTEAANYITSQFVNNVVPQISVSALSFRVYQVAMVGTTPTVVYSAPTGSTLSASQISAAQAVVPNGQSGIVVSASYTHTLQFFPTAMSAYLSSALTAAYTTVQLKS